MLHSRLFSGFSWSLHNPEEIGAEEWVEFAGGGWVEDRGLEDVSSGDRGGGG